GAVKSRRLVGVGAVAEIFDLGICLAQHLDGVRKGAFRAGPIHFFQVDTIHGYSFLYLDETTGLGCRSNGEVRMVPDGGGRVQRELLWSVLFHSLQPAANRVPFIL